MNEVLEQLDAAIHKTAESVKKLDVESGEYGEGPGEALEAYYEQLGRLAGLQQARTIICGEELEVDLSVEYEEIR